ncbi:MAG TPA: Dna2/Cas4 domain-containing protein [Anaerolineales bacterium]|nr:Dna2/Cas4 domain-containing protein [Anaerolineales bacterium]
MIWIAVVCLLLGLALFWQAGRQRKASGLPGGRIIYADIGRWMPLQEALYDPSLGLAGKPDYLVKDGEQIIPVEVKSSRVAHSPYDSHIYQLAAYCLLVGQVYRVRPGSGILHYPTRTFRIDFTAQLERAVLQLLAEMRSQDIRKEIHRSHDSPARCLGCGYRSSCDQKLS